MFRVAPPLDLERLETIFRYEVFNMLPAKGRIPKDLIAIFSIWRHSGFQVFCGQRIFPQDENTMGNLGRYISISIKAKVQKGIVNQVREKRE